MITIIKHYKNKNQINTRMKTRCDTPTCKGITLFLILILTLISCNKSDLVQDVNTKITYQKDIKPLIAGSCIPCHLPPDGFKTFFNTYDVTKSNIDEMIRRIQLPRADTLSMPWRRPALTNIQIQKFIQWKIDGLLEK